VQTGRKKKKLNGTWCKKLLKPRLERLQVNSSNVLVFQCSCRFLSFPQVKNSKIQFDSMNLAVYFY